ncbi:MAG: glycosyltransferase family 39 protein [Bacteroidales bacterium]|nr:glycosyltransferase family 39 protein [Bacteroidales bacterium]
MEQKDQYKIHLWLILTIIATAAVLRFIHYADFSLSNDELSALVRIQFDTFKDLVDKGFYVDGHPGGIQVFLYYWVKLFGDSEASLRFPFVVMGVLAVWFGYLTARLWFGKTSALFVAVCLALLQFPILYSQIARPYGSGLFLSMLTGYFWTRVIFHFDAGSNRKYFDTIAYTVATAAMMYNHYFSFLTAFVMGCSGLFLLRKENRFYYLGAGLAAALLFTPHIYITLNHLSIGGVGLWLGKPENDWLLEHIAYLFNNSVWVMVMVAFISLSGFLSSQKLSKKNWTLRLLAIIWFIVPIATGFFYSRFANPVLQHSVVIFSFPFLLFFLFSFPFWNLDFKRLAMLSLLALAILGSTVIHNKYYSTQHFGEFKDVAARIVEWDKQYGEAAITRAISVNNSFYIEYYLKHFDANPEFKQYDNRGGRDIFELKNILSSSQTNYFVYAWTKMVPYETHDLIEFYYPFVVYHIDYEGLSAITLFSKSPDFAIDKPEPVFSIQSNFNSDDLWRAPVSALDTSKVYRGKYSILMNPEIEYGPTFEVPAGDINMTEGCTVKIRAMVNSPLESSKALIVFSLEQWDAPVYSWVASSVSNYAVPNEWSPVFLTVPVNELRSTRDILKIYIWNPGKEHLFVDDIHIEVFDP